jgi:hypothetical protein
MQVLFSIFDNLSIATTLITALYYATRYKRLGEELKSFSHFVLLSGLVELVASTLARFHINNLPALHLYVLLGFCFISRFYARIFNGFINPRIMHWITGIFCGFTILNSLFIQSIFTFNSYALTLEAVLVVIFSTFTFIILLNDVVKNQWKGIVKSLNWINSGLFLYFSSGLVIFYFGHIITRFDYSFATETIWFFHSLFCILMYFCFFIGLWKHPRSSSS